GDQLSGHFALYNAANAVVSAPVVGPHAQGTFTTPAISVPAPAQGATLTYHWQVYSNDTKDNSAVAGPCYFTVDLTAPVAPTVTLDVGGVATPPPADGSAYQTSLAGTPLAFTFTPGGVATDTANYRWSVNSDTPGTETLTPGAPGAPVTKSLTLSSAGPN